MADVPARTFPQLLQAIAAAVQGARLGPCRLHGRLDHPGHVGGLLESADAVEGLGALAYAEERVFPNPENRCND